MWRTSRQRPSVLGHVLAIIAVAWILEGVAHDPEFVPHMLNRIDSLPVIHQMDEMLLTAIGDFMNAIGERFVEALSGGADGGVPEPLLPLAPSSPPAPSTWQPRVTVPGGPPFWSATPSAPHAPSPWLSRPSGDGITIVVAPSGPRR